jgi:hypothetical protein
MMSRRLDMYNCRSGSAGAAVATLAKLPHLTLCELSIWAHHGSELDHLDEWEWDYRLEDAWEAAHVCVVPPLAAVPALTTLTLWGFATLPPDLRQLSGLQTLQACLSGSEQLRWGAEPLTGLSALSHLVLGGVLPGKMLHALSGWRLCRCLAPAGCSSCMTCAKLS